MSEHVAQKFFSVPMPADQHGRFRASTPVTAAHALLVAGRRGGGLGLVSARRRSGGGRAARRDRPASAGAATARRAAAVRGGWAGGPGGGRGAGRWSRPGVARRPSRRWSSDAASRASRPSRPTRPGGPTWRRPNGTPAAGRLAPAADVLAKARELKIADPALNIRLLRLREEVETAAALRKAQSLVEAGETAQAAEMAKQLLDRDPNNADAMQLLATIRRTRAPRPPARPSPPGPGRTAGAAARTSRPATGVLTVSSNPPGHGLPGRRPHRPGPASTGGRWRPAPTPCRCGHRAIAPTRHPSRWRPGARWPWWCRCVGSPARRRRIQAAERRRTQAPPAAGARDPVRAVGEAPAAPSPAAAGARRWRPPPRSGPRRGPIDRASQSGGVGPRPRTGCRCPGCRAHTRPATAPSWPGC